MYRAKAAVNFGAMSHYSVAGPRGDAPAQLMAGGVTRLGEIIRTATTGSDHGGPAATPVPI